MNQIKITTPAFRIWATNRNNYLQFLEKHTLEQLNKVPPGFNNNLIWHLGHIIVVQQRLIYMASGLPINVPGELFERFKPGTRPENPVTAEEVEELKGLLFSLITLSREDFAQKKFAAFKEFTTSAGFRLASVEDALQFNNYHEALHYGYMMNIRKFL